MKKIWFLPLGIFIVDQATKWWARKALHESFPQEFLDGHFRLQLAFNDGAFLSWGANWPWILRWGVLVVFVSVFLFFLVRLMKSSASTQLQKISYALILGGGAGNLFDRIYFHSVTDFLWMGIGRLQTGIFNIADMAILAAVFVLIFEELLKRKKREGPSRNSFPESTESHRSLH